MPEGGSEIMGIYSHGLKIDLGNSEMIFVTGQIAQDANGNVVCKDIEGQIFMWQVEIIYKKVMINGRKKKHHFVAIGKN